jgi:hypothetical protein
MDGGLMPDPKSTTVTIPGWVKWVGGLLLGYLPVLLGGYITFHDMGQDIAGQKTQISSLKAQISEMKEKNHADDLVQTKVSTDLKYIRETMDRVEKSMDRLAQQ